MKNIEKLLWAVIVFYFYFDAVFTYFEIIPRNAEWNIFLRMLIDTFGSYIVFIMPIIYISILYIVISRQKEKLERMILLIGFIVFTSPMIIDYIILWISDFKIGIGNIYLYLSMVTALLVYVLVLIYLNYTKRFLLF